MACSFFILLFGWHIYQGDDLTALMYLSGSVVIIFTLLSGQDPSKKNLQLLNRLVFAGYTLVSLILLLLAPQKNSFLHLSLYLAYPLLAFYLLPFRVALLFVIGFSILANLLLMLQLEGAFRAIYILAFWLVTLLTSLNRFTHFTRQEALQKQLNRDPKTQLLNQDQLFTDLQKEQERAEREATCLGVICFTSIENFSLVEIKELKGYFAPYEGIYSVQSANKLVALVPLATPQDLQAHKKKLTQHLPHLTLSFQITSTEQSLASDLKAFTTEPGLAK
ncbi:hypothetical protein [Marinospirillum insulare]|uniref:hypothetical protein n=1 Tax=Marinospirillum insulare TaxID=217169 RepID=UPI00048973F4|nr:hypothetical protein [Marinospirillum insulare]